MILPKLPEITKAYLSFKEECMAEVARPFIKDFYFRKGTIPEKEWDEAQKIAPLAQPMQVSHQLAPLVKTEEFESLDRKMDSNLYLCLKNSKDGKWELPHGKVNSTELLLDAAKSQLLESFGAEIDTWFVGGHPVGHFKDIFYLKCIIMAGKIKVNPNINFRWMTKDECKQEMDPEYWKAISGMMQ